MPVQIIEQLQDFLIEGRSRGFHLSVSCLERLRWYNRDEKPSVRDDARLRAAFAKARDAQTLIEAIMDLLVAYRLKRNPKFTADMQQCARILAASLDEIRNEPDAALNSIDCITASFGQLGKDLKVALKRNEPMPEVSLSKVLHFIHPRRYWIVDSRVEALLFIWGYDDSFRGFGEFLKDLFSDPNINELETFLRKSDSDLIDDPDLRDTDPSFLKLIDKILWS